METKNKFQNWNGTNYKLVFKNDYWWKNILKKNYNLKRLGKLKI